MVCWRAASRRGKGIRFSLVNSVFLRSLVNRPGVFWELVRIGLLLCECYGICFLSRFGKRNDLRLVGGSANV